MRRKDSEEHGVELGVGGGPGRIIIIEAVTILRAINTYVHMVTTMTQALF